MEAEDEIGEHSQKQRKDKKERKEKGERTEKAEQGEKEEKMNSVVIARELGTHREMQCWEMLKVSANGCSPFGRSRVPTTKSSQTASSTTSQRKVSP
jgi:hypothetical protein